MKNTTSETSEGFFPSEKFFEDKMTEWLAAKLNRHISEIDPNTSFIEYDLDSIISAQMLNALEEYTLVALESHLTIDYKNISSLAKHLAKLATASTSANKKSQADVYDKHLLNYSAKNKFVLPDFNL